MANQRSDSRPYVKNSPFNAAREAARRPIVPIPVGDQVCHERHGVGKVVALDGSRAVIVDFGGGDYRRVNLDSTRLERL
ncbi:hypothetical protein PU560_12260 [Georgenia sp. 10Sc9-8]|uniref:Uncharacterized protein n=1 Tax=Georgenia halotolerans TaxID=3028317 RepID=A0ABT5TYT3_9MICO|nr:hypothetical protein [Georgenia halotolerans]